MGPADDEGPGPTFSPTLFYVGEGPVRFKRTFTEIGAVWRVPENEDIMKSEFIRILHFF